MAQFLRTSECSGAIDKIVRQAEVFLWLISPYVQINANLMESLRRKNSEGGIDMRLVYRKEDKRPFHRPVKNLDSLKPLGNLGVYRRANLHTKCYINEKEALVTSLNLYEYSQLNNDEWGILVTRQDDKEIYEEIRKAAANEIFEIFEGSKTEHRFGAPPPNKTPVAVDDRAETVKLVQEISQVKREMQEEGQRENDATRERPAKSNPKPDPSLPQTGVCIRDGAAIGFDILKPYCDKCFRSWSRYKNREYAENLCHACGQDCPYTDIDRPLCVDCRRKHGVALAAQGYGSQKPENAVCIRDGVAIEFNLSKPYCDKCFKSWSRYKNWNHVENFCHLCGCEGSPVRNRAICFNCYLNVGYLASIVRSRFFYG